jgi:hypothetical protein
MIEHRPIPEAQQKRIAALIALKGKSGAARILKRDRQTIKAAAAGLAVHPYIAEQLAAEIAERDRQGKNP